MLCYVTLYYVMLRLWTLSYLIPYHVISCHIAPYRKSHVISILCNPTTYHMRNNQWEIQSNNTRKSHHIILPTLTLHDVSTARMASTKCVGRGVFSISATVGMAASLRMSADPSLLPASHRLNESVSYAWRL